MHKRYKENKRVFHVFIERLEKVPDDTGVLNAPSDCVQEDQFSTSSGPVQYQLVQVIMKHMSSTLLFPIRHWGSSEG